MSRYWMMSVFFKGGWGSLSANFRRKGTPLTNLCWYQKTRVITLSCGIKILAVCSFVSSLSMRVRRMDRERDRQNYDPQNRASIAALHGKNSISKVTKYNHNTVIVLFLFRFHALAGFCLNSMDRQTVRPQTHYRMMNDDTIST